MNASLSTADRLTHLKIVATALAAAIVVVWIGIFSRSDRLTDGSSVQTHQPRLMSQTMVAETPVGFAVR